MTGSGFLSSCCPWLVPAPPPRSSGTDTRAPTSSTLCTPCTLATAGPTPSTPSTPRRQPPPPGESSPCPASRLPPEPWRKRRPWPARPPPPPPPAPLSSSRTPSPETTLSTRFLILTLVSFVSIFYINFPFAANIEFFSSPFELVLI